MQQANAQPNVTSYSSVINACAQTGDEKRAEQWFKLMQQANVELAQVEGQKGLGATLTRLGARLKAGFSFVSLITIPSKSNSVPVSTRLEPVY